MAKTVPSSLHGFLLAALGLLLQPACGLVIDDGDSGGNQGLQGSGTGGTPSSCTGSSCGGECQTSSQCADGQQCVRGTCQGVDAPTGDYCSSTNDWPEASATKELEILDIVNQRRAEGATCGDRTFGPQEPLEMLGSLQCAARVHTLDMMENDYFSHDGLDGSGPDDRMEAAGYDGRGWGENIAAGNADAADTMEQWMNSAGHCRNIMGNYRYIGVGYVTGGERRHIWTQTFGN